MLRCLLMLACLICSILISHFHLRFLKYLYKSVCKSCVCSSCMKSFAYQMKIHVHACFPAIYLCVNSCVYSCANSCVKHDQKGILEASFLKICPFKNLKGPTVPKGQKGVRNPSYLPSKNLDRQVYQQVSGLLTCYFARTTNNFRPNNSFFILLPEELVWNEKF